MSDDVLEGQPEEGGTEGEAQPELELLPSRQFPDWLQEQGISIGFTTYQAGKLFLIGTNEEKRLAIYERTLERCMGLVVTDQTLFVSTLYQIWRFQNALEPGQIADGYDRVYVPQHSYVTGDLDIHDLALDERGRLVFVNTLFGCLATPSETHSFRPLWQPPFLSKLAAEGRCHLNGLAMRDGRPAYVTVVAESDVNDGWRDRRHDGGAVIDIASGEIVCRGLSMPHSPRVYQDKLWLHNSGTGEFGYVDLDKGRFEPVAFCPGYLRGLSFVSNFALVGISNTRENRTFEGLALDEALKQRNAEPRCAIQVIDLRTGDVVHWLRIQGVVRELDDVAVLPGVRRPMLIGFKSDEIRRVISLGEWERL